MLGADFTVPDGQPLVWALRALGHRLQDRVYGPELMDRACARAARSGQRFYLYGGRNQGALAQLARALRLRHPGLKIVGGYAPPFRDADATPRRTRSRPTSTAPAPTSCGSGSACPSRRSGWRGCAPRLERAGADRRRRGVRLPRRARARRRPPRMQRVGLEWLFRLVQEPRRLWRRYLRYNPRFVAGFARQYAAAPRGALTFGSRVVRALALRARGARSRASRRARPTSTTTTRRPRRAAPATRGSSPARADGAILERHWTGGGWTDWASLGGNATSGPAAVGLRRRRCCVFVRGTDGAIYQNTLSDGALERLGVARRVRDVRARRDRAPRRRRTTSTSRSRAATTRSTCRPTCPGAGWSGWALARRQPDVGAGAELAVRRDPQRLGPRHRRRASRSSPGTARRGATGSSLGGGIIGAPGRGLARPRTSSTSTCAAPATRSTSALVDGGRGWSELVPARHDARSTRRPPRAATARRTSGCSPAAAAAWCVKEWNGERGWTAWTDLGPVAVPPPPAPRRRRRRRRRTARSSLETGLRCTPPGGRAAGRRRRSASRKGRRSARGVEDRLLHEGQGPRGPRRPQGAVRGADQDQPARPARRAACTPASTTGARRKGKLHRKTVSRRYTVCR